MKSNYGLTWTDADSAALEEFFVEPQARDNTEDLLDYISDMRADQLYAKRTNADAQKKHGKKLSEVLFQTFGIHVDVQCIDFRNFAVVTPFFNKEMVTNTANANRAIRKDKSREFKKFMDKNQLEFSKEPGVIDFKNAKVSGGFSKMKSILLLDPEFFFPFMTSEEFLSVLLHEVGHIFKFFASVHRTRRVLSVLNDIALAQSREPKDQRKEVLKVRLLEAARTGELPKEEVDEVLRTTDNEGHAMMMSLTKLAGKAALDPYEDMPTNSKFKKIHRISYEQSADVFVTRMGYGPEFVRFMERLAPDNGVDYKHTADDSSLSMISLIQAIVQIALSIGLLTSVASGTMSAGGLVIFAGIGVATILLSLALTVAMHNKSYDSVPMTYDSRVTRMKKIVENEIDLLMRMYKSNPTDGRMLKEKLADIKEMQNLLEGSTEVSTLTSRFANFFSSASRGVDADLDLRDRMEALARNKLVVASLSVTHG